MRTADRSGRERNRGFTLIEALITFVILSIGLLGIASLQALSKTSQHQTIQRTRAVGLADSMVERIRMNPAGRARYNIGLSPLGGNPGASEPSADCHTAACDPNELADHDLWAWEQSLAGVDVKAGGANAGGLSDPRGCVLFSPAPGMNRTGQLRVIVQWRGMQQTQDAVQAGEQICGGDAAGSDNLRRQLVVNTFVVDESEI